jgi:shikimate 5-dehydrogenase
VAVHLHAERQGGLYCGDEALRLETLRRASRAGVRYLDVESDVDEVELDAIPPHRRVLSHHDFSGLPDDLTAIATRLSERRPAVVKLACRVRDPAELAVLLDLRSNIEGEAVLLGMGKAGELSRVRYARFGSKWTYVASEAGPTAPGQLDRETAAQLGVPWSAEQPFFALVGGDAVHRSPGPRVYNWLFRRRGIQRCYLAVACPSLESTLPVLERLGAVGISVTMPHKREALALSRPDALAKRVGAVNSMRGDDGVWRGTNTDVEGVRAPLAELDVRGTALILGAGGAARAAVEACEQLGLSICVSARRMEEAARLDAVTVPWEWRGSVNAAVIINATAAGGLESPWPAGVPIGARVVYDLAMASRSRLCEQALEAGAIALDAQVMWIHQGALQMSWISGETISAAELQELMA